MILLFISILFTTISADTTQILTDIEYQTDYYINQISNSKNTSSNTWALYEVTTSSCEVFEIVKSKLSNSPDHPTFQIFKDLECEELSSLDIQGLNFWNEADIKKYNSFLQNGTVINSNASLPFEENLLIHFLLLMDSNFPNYYSIEYLNESLDEWKTLLNNFDDKKSLDYSILLANLIRVAYIVDDYEFIASSYEEFLTLNLFPVSIHKLKIVNAFDYTFYLKGYFDKSLAIQRNHTVPLASFLGNSKELESIKNRQGAYLFSLGKYQESKAIYEELYSDSVNFENQYALFTNLGVNYLKLGQSNKYISFQLRALQQDISQYKSKLSIYRNLFIYYTSAKDINSALQYIEKAKEVATENKDTTELALIDSYLGTFYWSQYRDHVQALENFNAAQQVLTPDNNYTKYVDLLYEKGNIYAEIDSLETARSLFNAGKELALSKSNTVDYLDALINLAAIELKENNINAANEILEEINLYSLDELDFPLLTKFFTVKSRFLYLTNNHRAAIDELAPVVDQVIDRAKNNTDSQEGFWSVEDEYLDAVELLVEMLISSQNTSEALTLLDKLKTINDAALYNSPLVKAAKLSEEDLAEEKKLNQRLQSLRKRYLNADEDNRFTIKQEIDRVSALREQILAEVELNKSAPLSPIWAVQRSIDEDELVLHFTEVGSTLYITRLMKDDVEITPFEFTGADKEYFAEIADALASGNTNLQALHDVYTQLELDRLPKDIQQITVVPDNFLYRIPLEILPSKQPDSPHSFGSTRYLIEDYQFRYFTSLKEFETNRRSNFSGSKTDYDFSGFGISDFRNFSGLNLPSLPYATIETRGIQTTLSSLNEKVIFTGDQATKEAFKSRVGNSRLVHVATHSEVSEQDPLFSTIYLTTDNPADTSLQSDQALYAYELFDTPLNSEFIMLNSCSSGSGSYIQGSGIMGISRALRYAGAKSLALNLWPVNDKIASEFATDFYTSINKGNSKSVAIREAKLNQLKMGNANPHFWGAYTMIGNPSPITPKSNYQNLFLAFLALGTVSIGFMAYSSGRHN